MGTTIGPKNNLIINGNEDYPIEKLKSLVVNGCVDENNYYFDKSAITLAKYDETPILDYTNNEGKMCGFWEFCKEILRNKGHNLNRYLLRTKFTNNPDSRSITENNSQFVSQNQFFSTDRKSYLKTLKPWNTSESIDIFPLSGFRNKPHFLNSSKVNCTDWKIWSTSEHEIRSISHVSVESPQYSQLTALQDNLHKESISLKVLRVTEVIL